jgi:hypothetical protein
MKIKNPINDLARKSLIKMVKTPRILTTKNVVITYTFAEDPDISMGSIGRIFDPAATDAKLIEILAANPQADLTKFEEVLGIKILDIQRGPEVPPEPPTRKRLLT